MTERTGLGALEVAALRAVDAVAGPHPAYARSSSVLDVLEQQGFGPAYLYPVLQDLAVPWKTRLHLLHHQGNFGSWGSDPAADPVYTEVRLSRIGRLALRAEAGVVGPVPLGLIEGSVYRGGSVPPFDPARVVDALQVLLANENASPAQLDALVGPPSLPTGGTVEGEVAALLAGTRAAISMSCRTDRRTVDGRRVLEITGYPLGVDVDVLLGSIASRMPRDEQDRAGKQRRLVADLQDRSTDRTGVRLLVLLRSDAGYDETEEWLRDIWPVTVEVDWRLPAPMHQRLREAAAQIGADPSGFEELRTLV